MFNYLVFVCGGLSAPSNSPVSDGEFLAEQCLQQLRETNNPEQFPPRLLILLTSPAYNDETALGEMLTAIQQRFAAYKQETFRLPTGKQDATSEELETHLIGSSVEAVCFQQQIHHHGALLICLASRLLETDVGVCSDIDTKSVEAIDQLLIKLKLSPSGPESNLQKPLTDRLLLSFMPNLGRYDQTVPYLAPELHALLQRNRMPLVGGVSSLPGFQFAGDKVYCNALVAARIFTGAPFGCSFGHGLQETDVNLNVTKLSGDGRTIYKFDQDSSPTEVLGLKQPGDTALLGELSLDNDPFITVARPAPDGHSVVLMRRITKNILLRRLAPSNPSYVLDKTRQLFQRSLERWAIEKPAGCFALHCISRLHPDNKLNFTAIAVDAEAAMERIYAQSEEKKQGTYFGGFFAGEFGGDESGRFLFGNWCVATLCFSDEMRERTPAHTGFRAISEIAPLLTTTTSLDEALAAALRIITETGFPGAMLSLLMNDKEGDRLVALKATGSRFTKVREATNRLLKEDDVLAIVARTGNPEFIPDSRSDSRCDHDAIKQSGIISQYLIPLFDRNHKLLAVLQIDIGDIRRRRFPGSNPEFRLYKSEERILHSFGAVAEATILRVLNRQEADIIRGLDDVLKESLRAANRDQSLRSFIVQASELFQVNMGHIRFYNAEQQALEMVAGTGEYYETFKESRRFSARADKSPTVEAYENLVDRVVVVNNSATDDWHYAMLKEHRDNPTAQATLKKVRSYANVQIGDSDSVRIGTVSLIAEKAWFFTRPRVRAMHALAERVKYLFDHFAEKERRFLLNVSSEFVRKADFTQPITTLAATVKRFCEQAQADVASLFLWDEESEMFVLRACDGWSDPNWVDAARYKKGERWTGSLALVNEPQRVPDLYAYKKAKDLHSSDGRCYEVQIFGEPLSETFTVEAIGLPLKMPNEDPIGILTLYRRPTPKSLGEINSFATIDPQRLHEAATTWYAMVDMLLHNLERNWFKEEIERHEVVREALERDDPDIPLEQRICQQMQESFRAVRVDLYLSNSDGGLHWATGATRNCAENTNTIGGPNDFIQRAAWEKKIMEYRHSIQTDRWHDPQIARTEGLIERVGLPLRCDEEVIGVLDLHYSIVRKHAALETRHDPSMLTKLADKIAIIYRQQKELAQKRAAEAEEEKSRSAVQFVGIVASHSGHLFTNTIDEINKWGERFQKDIDKLENQGITASGLNLRVLFDELRDLTDGTAIKEITRPLDLAKYIKDFTPRLCKLKPIINEILLQKKFKLESDQLNRRILVDIDDKLMVKGQYDLLTFAFHNIIHNSLKVLLQDGTLTISAGQNDDSKVVWITFKDTGPGMTPEEKQEALSSRRGGRGLPTTKHLIKFHGGQFSMESEKGIGTTVIITLPSG